MKQYLSFFTLVFLFAIAAGTWTGCVKNEFDEPPAFAIADIDPTMTIADLKAMYAGQPLALTEEDNIILEGIVVADDESGNFFRRIVIQDETAGIELLFDATDLFNDFPVGRQVFVVCAGLELSSFNGVIQVGTIPGVAIDDFVLRGKRDQVVEPNVVTIGELNPSLISTLVKIEGVQFSNAWVGGTFADPFSDPPTTFNTILEECDSDNTVILRNSGYSDFAGELVPEGSGDVTAIYGVFGSDQQLFIRDPGDLDFVPERCDGSTGALLFEDFESYPTGEDLDINGWTNYAKVGTTLWQVREFSNNSFAEVEAFQISDSEMEAWLVTPEIDMSTPKSISFSSAMAFWNHNDAPLKVWVASDYDGTNVEAASWQEIPGVALADENDDFFDWVPTGKIDLTPFGSGTLHVAFSYVGNPNDATTKIRIDDVMVEEL
jgi:hypothetical protein